MQKNVIHKTGKNKSNIKRDVPWTWYVEKKLQLTDCECRCHRIHIVKNIDLPETHSCSVDYKKLDQESFIEKAGLIACIPDKANIYLNIFIMKELFTTDFFAH